MSVVVYPRLAALLEANKMTVAELERHLKQRYRLEVNVKTLYRLAQAAPIQRADLEIAGAVTAILGVGLDDLFTVEAVAVDAQDEADLQVLGLADSHRMAAPVACQAQRLLTEEEWAEFEELIGKYGQLLHEHHIRTRAQRRGIPAEQDEEEEQAHIAQALAEWHASGVETQQQEIVAQSAERDMR